LSLVLDTSMTMTWGFEDEVSGLAEAVLDRVLVDGAHVPSVWPLEVANALLIGERRGRLSRLQIDRFLQVLEGLRITVDSDAVPQLVFGRISTLAREQRLSVYDASYLDLALRRGLPLATLDGRLRAAAERLGVPVVDAGGNGIVP
jgi:predicted nucleic acid-binding protein